MFDLLPCYKMALVFNEQGETEQLKLFPSHVEPPADDPQVARVLLTKVRLERTRQFGSCWLGRVQGASKALGSLCHQARIA